MQDRFATTRGTPSIDDKQDWELKNGEEESGFTILEFSRKYITCDEYDLPISVWFFAIQCSRPYNKLIFCRLKQPGLYGVSIMTLTFHLDSDTLARDLSVSTYWEVYLMQPLIHRTLITLISKLIKLVKHNCQA